MIFLFETIRELVSVPLEKWDKLRLRYKIFLFFLVIISIAGIIILLNQ